jgi:hypothetical protein
MVAHLCEYAKKSLSCLNLKKERKKNWWGCIKSQLEETDQIGKELSIKGNYSGLKHFKCLILWVNNDTYYGLNMAWVTPIKAPCVEI